MTTKNNRDVDRYLTIFFITLGGGGRSAVQVVAGVDALTAGGGGGGADCLKSVQCGGGGNVYPDNPLYS